MRKWNIIEVSMQESYPYNESMYSCLSREKELLEKNGDFTFDIPIIYKDKAIGAVEKIDFKLSLDEKRIIVTYKGFIGIDNLKPYMQIDGVHECINSIVIDERQVNGGGAR